MGSNYFLHFQSLLMLEKRSGIITIADRRRRDVRFSQFFGQKMLLPLINTMAKNNESE